MLPEAPSSPSASATAGTLAFSDSGGASLRFHGPRADYIVYSAVSGQWGERSGVAVERDGKPLANVRCTGRTTSQLGPALFERADFAHDERFVLPEE